MSSLPESGIDPKFCSIPPFLVNDKSPMVTNTYVVVAKVMFLIPNHLNIFNENMIS